MKILVAGSGAIGSVLGWFIHKSSGDITFAGRGEHIRAIKSKGLHITGIGGEYDLRDIAAIEPEALFSLKNPVAFQGLPIAVLFQLMTDFIDYTAHRLLFRLLSLIFLRPKNLHTTLAA